MLSAPLTHTHTHTHKKNLKKDKTKKKKKPKQQQQQQQPLNNFNICSVEMIGPTYPLRHDLKDSEYSNFKKNQKYPLQFIEHMILSIDNILFT